MSFLKQYRTGFLLLFVVLGLSGVAYWDEWQTKRDDESEKTKNKLFSITTDDVVKFRIFDSLSGATIVAEKIEGKWSIAEPVRARGDLTAINTLVQTVADYKYESEVGTDSSVHEKFGLDKPTKTVVLTTKDQKDHELQIGAKSPVGYSLYVKAGSSDKSYVGGQQLLTAVDKKLTDLRDKSVFEVSDDQIIELSVKLQKSSAPTIVKRASAKDPFELYVPGKILPASKDAVYDFLGSLRSEKATDFADKMDGKLKSARSPGFASIEWVHVDGTKGSMKYFESDKKLYVSPNGAEAAFVIAETFKDKLQKVSSDSWRDKTMLRFAAVDLASVEIDGSVFERSADGVWYAAGADKKDENKKQHVQNLAVDLEFAKFDKILSKVPSGAPQHQVVLNFKEGFTPKSRTLKVWPQSDDANQFLVQVDSSKEVYSVKKTVFDNIKQTDGASAPITGGKDGGELNLQDMPDLNPPSP